MTEEQTKKFLYNLIGIPYKFRGRDKKGLDCFTLILYFCRQTGKNIPDYDYDYDWQKINNRKYLTGFLASCETVDDLHAGDIILFRLKGDYPSHAGIYIEKNLFLHATEISGVIITRLTKAWREKIYIKGRIK